MKDDVWDPWCVINDMKAWVGLGDSRRPIGKCDVSWTLYEFGRQYTATNNRVYHTWQHVLDMLSLGKEHYRGPRRFRTPLVLAIVAHDVVYSEVNNEEKSCDFLRKKLQEYVELAVATKDDRRYRKLTKSIEEACRLIMLTKNHRTDPNDKLGWFMILLDLHILATDRLRYSQYAEAIKAEFIGELSELEYKLERTRWLRSMLNRVDELPELVRGDNKRMIDNLAWEINHLNKM